MNKIVERGGIGGGRQISDERYEIRTKAGSQQLYVRCTQRLCSFMARFCKDELGYYKYSIMSILYHYTECHQGEDLNIDHHSQQRLKTENNKLTLIDDCQDIDQKKRLSN